MFDETIRAIRALDGKKITIDMPPDENGCIDRVCPGPECRKHFKVLLEDWRMKVPDHRAFCPYCRHETDPQEWNTPEQIEYMKSVGVAHAQELIESAMAADARRHNTKERSRPKNRFIDISMTMNFRPDPRPVIIPYAFADALRQHFDCQLCGCRWSSLGSSFFCPACGNDSVDEMFDRTILTVRNVVKNLDILKSSFADPDSAEDAARQIIEDQLGRLIGAFEQLSASLVCRLSPSSRPANRGNIFQRVDDASAFWKSAIGLGYEGFLNAAELDKLRIIHQRRHILIHNQGIVDQKYIDRCNDSAYRVGQRVTVKPEDIQDLASMLETLAAGLRKATGKAHP